MGKASARGRLRRIVAGLNLPDDWTVEDFTSIVAASRGRPILLRPLPIGVPASLCGLWIAGDTTDLILHRQTDDPELVKDTVTHEIGHMLCDHYGDPQLSPESLVRYLTDIRLPDGFDVAQVRAARGHTDYDNHEEYEAELLSIMVRAKAERKPLPLGVQPRNRLLKAL